MEGGRLLQSVSVTVFRLDEYNGISCYASKCEELTIKKRGNRNLYSHTGMIPSCKEVEILGVTFQCESKLSVQVKNKLIKANKFLHILRMLCKEGYNQSEIDLVFNAIIVPPNINYAFICSLCHIRVRPYTHTIFLSLLFWKEIYV